MATRLAPCDHSWRSNEELTHDTRVHVDASAVAGTSLNDERRDVGRLREGSIAGALAAGGVALWYLFRDLMAGHALFTPRLLGQLLGIHAMSDGTATAIVGYTLVHFAGFIALGVVAAVVVRMAARQATVLAGAFLAFVIAEAAFWVVIGLLNQGTLAGMLGWSQLAAGNILGCAIVGITL